MTQKYCDLAVITLIRDGEEEAFERFWSALEPQIQGSRKLIVLANGSCPRTIRNKFKCLDSVVFVESPVNLGVAGGRNLLIHEALKVESKIVVSLDNDILVPRDYLDQIENIFTAKDANQIGLVAPILVNFLEDQDFKSSSLAELINKGTANITHSAMRVAVRDMGDALLRKSFYHSGIRHYLWHYLFSWPKLLNVFLKVISFGRMSGLANFFQKKMVTDLARSAYWRKTILNTQGRLEVDCVPGGAMAFRSEVYRKVGPIDSAFNPFGYEDAEYSVRVLHAGYKNFIATELIGVHDIQSRNSNRNLATKHFIFGKSRRLFLKSMTQNPALRLLSVMDSLLIAPVAVSYESVRHGGGLFGGIIAFYKGFFASATN
ncbi:MAG: glycosyltransferase family 2 protein [Pseudobdellovibrionaceae bacterium]